MKEGKNLSKFEEITLHHNPLFALPLNAYSQVKVSRASLTVRITVKNGDPSGAGKIWENRFFTGKMGH